LPCPLGWACRPVPGRRQPLRSPSFRLSSCDRDKSCRNTPFQYRITRIVCQCRVRQGSRSPPGPAHARQQAPGQKRCAVGGEPAAHPGSGLVRGRLSRHRSHRRLDRPGRPICHGPDQWPGRTDLPARTVGAAEKRQGWECGADGRRGGQPLPGQADRLAAQVRRFRLDADPSQARTPWAQPLPPAGPLLPALPAP